jgi:hypothetical protein
VYVYRRYLEALAAEEEEARLANRAANRTEENERLGSLTVFAENVGPNLGPIDFYLQPNRVFGEVYGEKVKSMVGVRAFELANTLRRESA